MRRVSMLAMAAVLSIGAVAAGCTVPPTPGGGPYACDAGSVDLGPADRIVGLSHDGQVVLLQQYDDSAVPSFDVVDRRAGTRRQFLTTSPEGDGAQLHLDPAGDRVLGHRYPELAPDESAWFLHDFRTGVTQELSPGISADDQVHAVAADLQGAIVQNWTSPDQPFRLVDPATGVGPVLGLTESSAWRLADFSPDLSLALQYSSTRGFVRSVRVVSTATGGVVRDLGQVRAESEWSVSASFVDDSTVLIDDAVPNGSPADGIATDGAFVVDLSSGAVTRVDPGVAGTSTRSATADGSRSVYSIILEQSTWLRVAGTNQQVATSFEAVATPDHSVVVTVVDGVARLRCA